MTTPTPWQPPPYGSDEWYEFMDGPLPTYDDVDVPEDLPSAEPQVEVLGAPDGRAELSDQLRIRFQRPDPPLDATGHPVRQVSATITTSSGATVEVPLVLSPDWDPQHPGDVATYTSGALSGVEAPHTGVLPVGDGDGLSVGVGGAEASVERFHGSAHELAMWRLEQGIRQRGLLVANLLRTFKQATAGIDSPVVEGNLQVLTETLRSCQLALDHLHDPAHSERHELSRGRYYLLQIDGALNATNVGRLLDGQAMQSPFSDDPRQAGTFTPEGGVIPEFAMSEWTHWRTFDKLVEDADSYGECMHASAVNAAATTAVRDLTLQAYDEVVGKTIWGWAWPLAELAVTGEARDHHGRRLSDDQLAALGVTLGFKAFSLGKWSLGATGRAGLSSATSPSVSGAIEDAMTDHLVGAAQDTVEDEVAASMGATLGHVARAAGLQPGPTDDPVPEAAPPPSAGSSSGLPVSPTAIGATLLVALLLGIGALLLLRDGGGGSDQPATGAPAEVADGVADTGEDLPAVLDLLGLSDADGVDLAVQVDPAGGLSWSIVGTDGVALPASSIDGSWALRLDVSQPVLDELVNRSVLPCGAVVEAYRVTCPPGATRLAAGEYLAVGIELGGPVADGAGRFTYALAFDDGDDADDLEARPPYDADFFAGTESWYSLEVAADGSRAMWADGIVDGVPGRPRHSSALVVEQGDTLLWLIPVEELPAAPGGDLGYRATAFHDDGPVGVTPDPATSGGDVTGSGVDEPLLPVAGDVVVLDDVAALPDELPDHDPRPELAGDADAHLAAVLFAELEARLGAALAAGSEDAVLATVLPSLLEGPDAAACQASVADTIAQADAIRFTEVPSGPDTSSGVVTYPAVAEVAYPTGAVAWSAIAVPGPGGRLHLVLPACVGGG